MKKIILVTVAAVSMMTTLNLAYAAPTTPPSPNGNADFGLGTIISNSIAGLEQYIGTLYGDGKAWIQARDHRPITNLTQVQATNTAQVKSPIADNNAQTVSPTKAATLTAQQNTVSNLHDSLMQYNYAMYRRDKNVVNEMKTSEGKPFKNYIDANSLMALTVGENAGADDTLSVRDMESKISTTYLNPGNKLLLETPQVTHNNYLDFSGLLNSSSYTTSQEQAAKEFLKYAAQSAQNLTSGIDFEKLYGNPSALLQVKQNSTYQHYVMMIRTLLALRSVTVNSLNQLFAERTPIPGLGQAAGLQSTTDTAGQPTTTTYPPASPLQVEAYQANHRVESPAWYHSIETASPASLQRETLIVLAEIEHQNYQAHLDRERILSELSAMNLQFAMANMKIALQQGGSQVNTVIQQAVSGASAPATSGSGDNTGINTTATPGDTATTNNR